MKKIILLSMLALIVGCSDNIINVTNTEIDIAWASYSNIKAWFVEGYEGSVDNVPSGYRYKCSKITLYNASLLLTFEKVDGTSDLMVISEDEDTLWSWGAL